MAYGNHEVDKETLLYTRSLLYISCVVSSVAQKYMYRIVGFHPGIRVNE